VPTNTPMVQQEQNSPPWHSAALRLRSLTRRVDEPAVTAGALPGSECGVFSITVETLEAFERAFAAALTSGRPTAIDAKITRRALSHYSSSPRGVIPAIWERWKSVSAVADNFPLSPHDG
jgi:hypothetical protein